jgi:hypothetical protein
MAVGLCLGLDVAMLLVVLREGLLLLLKST